jgi:MerR family redox-sensitive transcriptional activator SoxR
MPQMTISEVARKAGLNSSAIRYYERIGILPSVSRISGQRRYDATVLFRLAVVRRAQRVGFSLDEIRHLFCGYHEGTRAEARWRELTDRKLTELATIAAQIEAMQALLKRMKSKCHCSTLDVCGKAILEKDALCEKSSCFEVDFKF